MADRGDALLLVYLAALFLVAAGIVGWSLRDYYRELRAKGESPAAAGWTVVGSVAWFATWLVLHIAQQAPR